MLSQMALHLFFLNVSFDAESSVTYSAMVKKEGGLMLSTLEDV